MVKIAVWHWLLCICNSINCFWFWPSDSVDFFTGCVCYGHVVFVTLSALLVHVTVLQLTLANKVNLISILLLKFSTGPTVNFVGIVHQIVFRVE